MSRAYHDIYRSGMASEYTQVDDALQGKYSTLDSTDFSKLLRDPTSSIYEVMYEARTRSGHIRRPTGSFAYPGPPI